MKTMDYFTRWANLQVSTGNMGTMQTGEQVLQSATLADDGSRMTEKQLAYALDMAHKLGIKSELTLRFKTLTYAQGQLLINELRRSYDKIVPASEKQIAYIKKMLICPEIRKTVGELDISRLSMEQAKRFINRFRATHAEWYADRPDGDSIAKAKALYKRATGLEMSEELEGFLSKNNIDSVIDCYAAEIGLLKVLEEDYKKEEAVFYDNLDRFEDVHHRPKHETSYAGYQYIPDWELENVEIEDLDILALL